jgi:hypothetical protein
LHKIKRLDQSTAYKTIKQAPGNSLSSLSRYYYRAFFYSAYTNIGKVSLSASACYSRINHPGCNTIIRFSFELGKEKGKSYQFLAIERVQKQTKQYQTGTVFTGTSGLYVPGLGHHTTIGQNYFPKFACMAPTLVYCARFSGL